MAAARKHESRPSPIPEDIFDRIDVPAAVVCALCGYADCPGCEYEPTRSGVVALVAWERPGASFFSRLWLTARGTTRTPERFFEGLPDGPVLPALRFALACELIVTAMIALCALPLIALVAPEWLSRHVSTSDALEASGRMLLAAIPAFAALLVFAHAAHGLALDLGARRQGGAPHRSRALRFGLYAAGWDLVLGPIGVLFVLAREGFRSAALLFVEAVGLPRRASSAFVASAYRLEGATAERAVATASSAVVVLTLVSALIVVAGLVALSFF